MTTLTFNSLPPSGEFRKALAQALATANPVDDLLALSHRLFEYEQEHRMPSADFYQQYQAGTLDDDLQHCVDWAAVYDLFVKTKRIVEATLMRAAIQTEVSEAMV